MYTPHKFIHQKTLAVFPPLVSLVPSSLPLLAKLHPSLAFVRLSKKIGIDLFTLISELKKVPARYEMRCTDR